MSEQPQPDEDDGAQNPADADELPMRRGWFYYVAVFFIMVAGICFILANNLDYHPSPLPPRPPAVPAGGGK